MIPLYKSTALDDAGAYEVSRSMPTNTVALVGPVKCGKTTLIAGVHQAFLYGPLEGYAFRASRTLSAFEEKCFNSRVASGAEEATTPRTSRRAGREYYHLSLRRQADAAQRQMLLLDMSGEFYEGATNSVADAEQLKLLGRATRVSMILDGARLSDGQFREKVYIDTKMLLRRFDEVGCLSKETPLQFVVTKLDRMMAGPFDEEIEKVLEQIRDRFPNEASRPNFSLLAVTASPRPQTTFPMRFGLGNLFRTWLEVPAPVLPPFPKVDVSTSRMAGRLAVAWLPEKYT